MEQLFTVMLTFFSGVVVVQGDLFLDPGYSDDIYGLVVNRFDEGDKCKQQVVVSGKGVKDTFDTVCAYNYNTYYASHDRLVSDSPEADFSLFSDEPSTLYVVRAGKCSKKLYTTRGSRTTSVSSTLTDKQCDELKKKIRKEVEEIRNESQSIENEDNVGTFSDQLQSEEYVSDGSDDNSDDISDDSLDSWNF